MNWHMLEAIDSAKSSPSGPKTLLLFWRICLTTASRWGLPSWVNSSHFIVVAFAGAGTPDVVVDVVIGPPGSVVIATEPCVFFSHAARLRHTTTTATATATARTPILIRSR